MPIPLIGLRQDAQQPVAGMEPVLHPHPRNDAPAGSAPEALPRRQASRPAEPAPRQPGPQDGPGKVMLPRAAMPQGRRAPGSRTRAPHHDPESHGPALAVPADSGSAEALAAARFSRIGPAGPSAASARASGAGGQVWLHHLPVQRTGEASKTRLEQPLQRPAAVASALQAAAPPVENPVLAHPDRYSTRAKAVLKERISAEGPRFRTTPDERREFRDALLFQLQSRPAPLGGAAAAQAAYARLTDAVGQIRQRHPELRDMPTEDLMALRAWTEGHCEGVDDALQGEAVPHNPLGLSYAKALVSALHALPLIHTHAGPVYSVADAPADAPEPAARAAHRTEWRFFTASQAREACRAPGSVTLQTRSLTGRLIAPFAGGPLAHDVVFVPGTPFSAPRVHVAAGLRAQAEMPRTDGS